MAVNFRVKVYSAVVPTILYDKFCSTQKISPQFLALYTSLINPENGDAMDNSARDFTRYSFPFILGSPDLRSRVIALAGVGQSLCGTRGEQECKIY